jgi:hypothetical protein
LEGSCRELIRVLPLEGLRKSTGNISQNRRCSGRTSNRSPAECKSTLLLLDQRMWCEDMRKQQVLGSTNRIFSLMWQWPHWRLGVQQFFHCCVCSSYRGNVSTEPLPNNDMGILTEPLPSNDWGDFYRGGDTQTIIWSHKPTLFLAHAVNYSNTGTTLPSYYVAGLSNLVRCYQSKLQVNFSDCLINHKSSKTYGELRYNSMHSYPRH